MRALNPIDLEPLIRQCTEAESSVVLQYLVVAVPIILNAETRSLFYDPKALLGIVCAQQEQ